MRIGSKTLALTKWDSQLKKCKYKIKIKEESLEALERTLMRELVLVRLVLNSKNRNKRSKLVV